MSDERVREVILAPGEILYAKHRDGQPVDIWQSRKDRTYSRTTASGTWVDPTPDPDPDPDPLPVPPVGTMPRLTRAYVDSLPRSGLAYQAVVSAAKGPRPDLSNQEAPGSAAMLARGLLNDKAGVAADLAACITTASKTGPDGRRTLNLARESQPIALAALLTGNDPLPAIAAVLAQRGLADRGVGDGTLRTSAVVDPVNWGAHARGAIAWFAVPGAIPKEEAADNLRRYLVTGFGFEYKSDQQTFQPDPANPVCVGPVGVPRPDPSADGCLTNDAYRGDTDTSEGPPVKGDGLNYCPEGFQGTVSAALALVELGLDAFEWGDRAILRAGLWMYRNGMAFAGDDRWMGWVLRRRYGAAWPHPLETPTSPGKGWAFTDWTHA